MAKKNRLNFISFLQIFGIILVVIGHSLHEYPVEHGVNTLGYRLIYSFHMPLFMWISGFLYKYTQKRTSEYSSFLSSKFQRLIIPYLFLSSVTFLPRCLMSGAADTDIDLSIRGFVDSMLYYDKLVIPFFWFLQSLFIIMNIVYGMRFLDSKKENVAIGTGFVLSLCIAFFGLRYNLSFFSLGNALYFLMFFLFGMLCCKYFERLRQMLDSQIALAVNTVLWILCCCIEFYYNEIFEVLSAFFGILSSVSFSLIVSRRIHNFGLFEGTSFMIYLLSWYPGVACQQVLHSFTEWEWWVYTLLAIFAGILFPVFVYHFLIRFSARKWAVSLLWILGHKKITRHLDEQSL